MTTATDETAVESPPGASGEGAPALTSGADGADATPGQELPEDDPILKALRGDDAVGAPAEPDAPKGESLYETRQRELAAARARKGGKKPAAKGKGKATAKAKAAPDPAKAKAQAKAKADKQAAKDKAKAAREKEQKTRLERLDKERADRVAARLASSASVVKDYDPALLEPVNADFKTALERGMRRAKASRNDFSAGWLMAAERFGHTAPKRKSGKGKAPSGAAPKETPAEATATPPA